MEAFLPREHHEEQSEVEPPTPNETVINTIGSKLNNWLIGGTFSPSKGYSHMFKDAKESKANCLQFFISKSDQWPAQYIVKDEKYNFEKAIKSAGWSKENLIVHGHLHLNLASSNKAT